ncbi:hypothetical protein ACGF5F_28910 [Streptomyces sp. NPDC047821]|uniref:hypothetical protein n=1 Tax=Streptomyces sp. NPDC047821 TaxID=3365488 RepID=UPI003710EAA1
MSEATDAPANAAEGEQGAREIPPPEELTVGQYKGWSCVFCGTLIRHGGRLAGVTRGRDGAHDLDTEVYAGPCCP